MDTMTVAQAAEYWGITEDTARRRLSDHQVRPVSRDPGRAGRNAYDAEKIRAIPVRRGRRTDLTEITDRLHAAGIPYRVERPPQMGTRWVIDGGQPLSSRQARQYLADHPRVQALTDPPSVTHTGTAVDDRGVPRRALPGTLQTVDTGVTNQRGHTVRVWRLTDVTAEHVTASVPPTDVPAALDWATRLMAGHGHHVTGWQRHTDAHGTWWEPLPPVTSGRDRSHADVTGPGDLIAELTARAFTVTTLPGETAVYGAPDGRTAVTAVYHGAQLAELVVRNLADPTARAVRIRCGRPPLDRAREALVQSLDALGYPAPAGQTAAGGG